MASGASLPSRHLARCSCIYKTRSQAQAACKNGRVEVNGDNGKAHRAVRPGDEIKISLPGGRKRTIEVVEIESTNVSTARARELYIDHTPPPTPEEIELRKMQIVSPRRLAATAAWVRLRNRNAGNCAGCKRAKISEDSFSETRVATILRSRAQRATPEDRMDTSNWDTLVVGGTILTMEPGSEPIPDGAIAIADGRSPLSASPRICSSTHPPARWSTPGDASSCPVWSTPTPTSP